MDAKISREQSTPKSGCFYGEKPRCGCHKLCYARRVPRSRPTFQPAGAGMLLAATTAASVGIGALIGWVAGNAGYGILGGAIVGVPAGIGAVYFRYHEALS